ncbi:MAG: SMP-30/gluconolactonase/LRE family protein [Spirochaetia bacterium]
MVFVDGLNDPETPRHLMDGSWMVVEMRRPGRITRISADGKHIQRIANVEKPIGLAVGPSDSLWVAATLPDPAVLRVSLSGSVEVFSTSAEGKRFLHPNDLCFGPDGKLYVTDSGMRPEEWEKNGTVREDYQNAVYDGRVYQIDIKTGKIRIVDSRIRFANGIAFGPDKNLYVNEMVTGNVYRYLFNHNGEIGARELFANVLDQEWIGSGFRGPDGMCFDSEGLCYCAVYGQSDVAVLSPRGLILRRIETRGREPTNVSFGLAEEKRLYVTEKQFGAIEWFDIDAMGAFVYHG